MRARRTAFVFFVCAIIVAYVKFYDLLKKDTQALNIQQIVESKTRSPRTKYSDASSKETQDEVITKGNKNDVIRRDSRDDIINDLEKQISKLRDQLNELNKQCDMPTNTVEGVSDKTTTEIKSEKSAKHSLNRQTKGGHGATVTANKPRKVIPSNRMNEQTNFNLFTIENIFFVNPGEKPRTYFTNQNLAGEYEHLNDAVDETMAALKKHLNLNSSLNLTLKTGVYRNDVNFGVEYDIQVMYEGDKSTYNVRLVRPLSPLILLHPPVKVNLDKLVNIIVPLQGRLESFREFLDNFKKVCVLRKENVFLTVVYSGTKGERDVRKMLNTLTKEYDFKKFELVTRKQNFNRGHALDEGVRNWKGQEDVLLFFCDVDIAFNSDFIDRCRIYSEPGRKVYYPMVFSFYNPKYVQETTRNFWKICKFELFTTTLMFLRQKQ